MGNCTRPRFFICAAVHITPLNWGREGHWQLLLWWEGEGGVGDAGVSGNRVAVPSIRLELKSESHMQELTNIANDLGLQYGLEVVNRYETNLANTAYQVRKSLLADECNSLVPPHHKRYCTPTSNESTQSCAWLIKPHLVNITLKVLPVIAQCWNLLLQPWVRVFLVMLLQAMELVDAVGTSNIGVHLDTYHMNIEENNFEKAIALCGKKLMWASAPRYLRYRHPALCSDVLLLSISLQAGSTSDSMPAISAVPNNACMHASNTLCT